MLCLLEPWAVTLLCCRSASLGTQGLQTEVFFLLLCFFPIPTALFQSVLISACVLQILLQNLILVFFHCHFPVMSKLALNLGEARGRTQVAPELQAWCLSCLGRITKQDKDGDWAVMNFSVYILFPVLTSHESSSISCINVFIIFSNMCILLNLKGASYK